MRGEFIAVWSDTHDAIWADLEQHEKAPRDLYCELYRGVALTLTPRPTIEELADIIDDPEQSREAFLRIGSHNLTGERALVSFLEDVHDTLTDLGGDPLANHYFNLLEEFVRRFSLRYDLRRPCQLCPTLPGVFASLVSELRATTTQDSHLHSLMRDFENSIRDLRADASEGRIKTCIQKQMNLLEALGRSSPGVSAKTLGAISDQVGTWPHETLKAAMKSLYGFSCDYPGIRHGGTPTGVLRHVEMRDLVAVTILLTGFTPYLRSSLSAEGIFGGGLTSTGSISLAAGAAHAPGQPNGPSPKTNGFTLRRAPRWLAALFSR